MSTILCIESDAAVRGALEQALRDMGLRAVLAASLAEGLHASTLEPFDLVIAGHRLRDGSAMDLLTALRASGLDLPVLVTSSYHSVEEATQCLRHGAVDYLTEPLRAEAVRLAVTSAIEMNRMQRVHDDFERELTRIRGARSIVGQSPALRAVMETVQAPIGSAGAATNVNAQALAVT